MNKKAKEGMERSQRKADQIIPGWTEKAQAYFRRYCQRNDSVTVENARLAAPDYLKHPEIDGRSWGSVGNWALREGLITFTEQVARSVDPSAHGDWVKVHRSNIYKKAA